MKYSAARDAAEAFARFVFVGEKGEPREVYEREAEWLATPFDPTDGDRPYIKTSYESLTPGGTSMHGFLERRLLPRKLHKRILRRDAARRQWVLPGARTIVPAVSLALPSLLVGYLAFVTSAFVSFQFMRPGHRGLGVALFVVAIFFITGYYILVGPFALFASHRLRYLQFTCATAAWLGFVAGAVWILWLHGIPSNILWVEKIP